MTAVLPETRSILKLYKNLLRYSSYLQHTDKDFYIRFIKKEFTKNRELSDPNKIQFQFQDCSFLLREDWFRALIAKTVIRILMLRKLHLLRQPFAIAPVRYASAGSQILLASINAGQAAFLQQLLSPTSSPQHISYRSKHVMDKSLVPSLNEEDLEEHFIKGSGPGGSNVNKRTNCCHLKHKPTGIIVKCHLSRLLDENRKLAREMMIEKLDNHFNGEMSIAAQKERLLLKKSVGMKQKAVKLAEQKKRYQELIAQEPSESH